MCENAIREVAGYSLPATALSSDFLNCLGGVLKVTKIEFEKLNKTQHLGRMSLSRQWKIVSSFF